MMEPQRLEQLGLTIRDSDVGPEAELELQAQLMNPLTRQMLDKVVFALVGERLIAIEPPEFIGLPPINAASVQRGSEIESQLADAFNENILHVQRRSKELQALGVSPKVDHRTLALSVDLSAEGHSFTIQSDKRGNFRLTRAVKGSEVLQISGSDQFELSEFRDQRALGGYLLAMVGGAPAGPDPTTPRASGSLNYGALVKAFGKSAVIPPTTAVELVVPISVNGAKYRFAAARVEGELFRGLLAGPAGKVWSDRFELSSFPGIAATVAKALGVDEAAVQVSAEEA